MYDQVTLGLNVDPFILSALKEDITSEDVSTNSVMPNPTPGVVDLICKEDGIICGLQVFERVFTLLDSSTRTEFYVKDGDHVENKQLVGKIYGDIRVLLCGERTALNYLQRMSGIATYTSQVAALLEGTGIKLLDTRKTTPNNRIFEKYSVRVGGGNNHRYNLSDGVLLKDNHIGAAGGVKQAISMAKAYAPFVRKIEIEVENLDMVKEAVEAGADINKRKYCQTHWFGCKLCIKRSTYTFCSYYGFIYEESSSGGVSPIRLNSPTDSNYQNGSHLFPAINTSQNMFDKGSTR